jgi:hypothetical protein
LTAVQVSVYSVDAELLFTTDPFGQSLTGGSSSEGGGRLGKVAFVAPTAVATVDLAANAGAGGGGGGAAAAAAAEGRGDEIGSAAVRLSEVFPALDESSCVLIEVGGGGLKRTITRLPSRLQVDVTESLGLATVLVTGDASAGLQRTVPAVGAYVRVAARVGAGGAPWFYKVGEGVEVRWPGAILCSLNWVALLSPCRQPSTPAASRVTD